MVVFLISVNLFPQEIREKSEELIRTVLGKGARIEMIKFAIPAKLKAEVEKEARQKFWGDHIFIFKIVSGGESYYGLLDNVLGKSMPITFLVIFNEAGEIVSSDIIKYREQYGGQVSSRRWNDQFKNKTASSDFTPGKSVDNITGATISVNSVTSGIKKSALLFKYIRSEI
jgi:Na+-translocating ferredoxin:NAD+ oxidoreductase RnfG subunit